MSTHIRHHQQWPLLPMLRNVCLSTYAILQECSHLSTWQIVGTCDWHKDGDIDNVECEDLDVISGREFGISSEAVCTLIRMRGTGQRVWVPRQRPTASIKTLCRRDTWRYPGPRSGRRLWGGVHLMYRSERCTNDQENVKIIVLCYEWTHFDSVNGRMNVAYPLKV
jgi:hypothetical protein